jgi:hypothetical protein
LPARLRVPGTGGRFRAGAVSLCAACLGLWDGLFRWP